MNAFLFGIRVIAWIPVALVTAVLWVLDAPLSLAKLCGELFTAGWNAAGVFLIRKRFRGIFHWTYQEYPWDRLAYRKTQKQDSSLTTQPPAE
jgi:hypothetical protein